MNLNRAHELRNRQRDEWNAVAEGWKRWWPTFEQAARHVSQRLVELAEIKEGQRVLDIAAGLGEPALTAARAVGPSGFVVATDQAPAMLDMARARAAEAGISNVRFVCTDAETLEVGETDFDAAICRWGLMFVPDLEAAMRAVARHLKPGGRFATALWASPEKVPMISLANDRVRALAKLPPPEPGALDPFRLADTAPLRRALEATGFAELYQEEIEVQFGFASAQALFEFRCDVSAPFRALMERAPQDLRDEIRNAIVAAANEHAQPDGSVVFKNTAICLAARKSLQ